jgi:hypothetical protein
MESLYVGEDSPNTLKFLVRSSIDDCKIFVNKERLAAMSPVLRQDQHFLQEGPTEFVLQDVPGNGLAALIRLDQTGEVS